MTFKQEFFEALRELIDSMKNAIQVFQFSNSEQDKKVSNAIIKMYELFDTLEMLPPMPPNGWEENSEFDKKIKKAFNEAKIFIKEIEKNYAPENPLTQKMFSGKLMNATGRARANGIFEPFEGKLVVDGVNIFLPESVKEIGVGAAKIFRYAVAEFTKHNPQNGTGEKLKLRFLLDVKDFAAANGIDTDSTSAMKNFRFKLNKSLNKLLKSSITWTEKIKGEEKSFSGYNYIGGYELRGNALKLEFTLKMAEYLTLLPIIEYPRSLYRLDDRDFNAFAIGEAMCIHYSQDNNVIKGIEGKLGVETLLKYTSFPTYEELKKHKWSWEEKVKEPFENCLDKLYQCGFLKEWSYCYSGGKGISDEKVRAGTIDSYEKFTSLIVKFELNDYEDSKIRVQKIAEKKAEKIKKIQAKRKNKKKADNN